MDTTKLELVLNHTMMFFFKKFSFNYKVFFAGGQLRESWKCENSASSRKTKKRLANI